MLFLKAHSFGNDFIILSDPSLIAKKNFSALAKKLCDRHTGIGADGILITLPSKKADTCMKIINSDGSEAKMCGNGIRCLAKYLFEKKIIQKPKFTIATLAGIIRVELIIQNHKISSIKVDMGKPIVNSRNIQRPIKILGQNYHITSLIMGNPHAVIFVDTLNKKEATKIGPILENHPLFPQKTNVNFVKVINPSEIKLLTWERGVGLSMACGTGACAAVVAASINKKTTRDVTAHLGIGDLLISWNKNNTVYMTGPAPKNICEGEILL